MGRFSGNTSEHAPVFIPCMWAYAVLVDSETAGCLGLLYCFNRAIYPLFYVLQGRFTMWFENITQTGYAVNGTFFLGLLMRGLGYDYIGYAKENPVLVPFLGAAIGVFTLLHGVGITIPWFIWHTLADRARKEASSRPLAAAAE